jgi:Predicted nucleotide-binding protein containing TIR-like domain/Histidine-specific methyltransferase, SAM-dependent
MSPSIVILSTKEGLPIAQRLKMSFQANWRRLRGPECLVQVWDELFPTGTSYLDALARIASDFVVVVFTGDDTAMVRNESLVVPRDNVIFELGYFTGRMSPRRVILVAEQGIKIPSDYAGISHVSYKKPSWTDLHGATTNPMDSCGVALVSEISAKWLDDNAISLTPVAPKTSFIGLDIPGGERFIPVYRDVLSVDDWFAMLHQALRTSQPRLDSKMLYFGPGFASGWVQTTQSNKAFALLRRTFREQILPMLRQLDMSKELTLVDLGVGDLSRGTQILDYYLEDETRKLSYVAVDISYEMLKIGMKGGTRSLAAVHEMNGRVWAINAEFANLDRYRGLFGTPGCNLFLLLGNTVGNEANEYVTLRNLFKTMSRGDKLIIEYQALEEEPLSSEELTNGFQKQRSFFTAPFTSLGCPAEAMDFMVIEDHSEARVRGINATTYKFVCRFKREVELRHFAFAEPLLVPKGDVCVYLVRKYEDSAMPRLLESCGFVVENNEIVPAVGSEQDGTKRRRFGYLVAAKPRDTKV